MSELRPRCPCFGTQNNKFFHHQLLGIDRQTVMISRQIRTFTTTASRKDIFDFLRRRSIKSEEPEVATKSTSEVMKDAEKSTQTQESDKPVKKNLRIVGVPQPEYIWSRDANGFKMKAWPVSRVDSTLTADKITSSLKALHSKFFSPSEEWSQQSLADLPKRFEFSKAVIADLKVTIPDHVLSSIQTVGDIEQYYITKVAGVEFNEKEPDALYLKPDDFADLPNVTVADTDVERRTQVKKWKNVLREAKAADAKREDELMQKALE